VAINIRAKGQTGEREIADMLNYIVYKLMKELKFPEQECLKGISTIQRNQNQSAVGGNDLTNCFGLSIEVKRQEQLSVNTWWKQCITAADRNNEMPVLIYRQNRKSWHVRTYGWINVSNSKHIQTVVEIDLDTFKECFMQRVRAYLLDGGEVKV
jgi:hypothetical protein